MFTSFALLFLAICFVNVIKGDWYETGISGLAALVCIYFVIKKGYK